MDLDNALEVADKLAILGHPTSHQDEYLETLSILIERYEEVHHAIDQGKANPLANLRFLLRQHGMTASDLGKILGQLQLGSTVLSGVTPGFNPPTNTHRRASLENTSVASELGDRVVPIDR